MNDFNREQWIDEAGALWARIVNMRPADFEGSAEQVRLSYLVRLAGLEHASAQSEAGQQGRKYSENRLKEVGLHDLALYFDWLRSETGESLRSELYSWRLRRALTNLIERASELPVDHALLCSENAA